MNGGNSASRLNLNGGTVTSGPITAEAGVIHAATGVTVAATSATFTARINSNALKGRFLGTGGEFVNPLYPGNTEAGIAAIASLPAVEATLRSALTFGGQGGADGVISAFFGGVNAGQRFSMGFFGDFTAPTTGIYTFQTGIVDDTAGFWIDLDHDGVFKTAGAVGNELIASGTCCGDGATRTANLVAGEVYKVGIAVEDTGGGSSLEGRIGLPGFGIGPVNPGSGGQAGLWSYEVANQVVVDVGAELDIRAINGAVDVIVNGQLKLTGAGSSSMNSLEIGPGAVVTLGGPALAPAEQLAGGAAAVPEPGSLGLALLGALGLLSRRRR